MGGGICCLLLKRRLLVDGWWGLGDDVFLWGDLNDDLGVGEGLDFCWILFMLYVVIVGMISVVIDEIYSLIYVVWWRWKELCLVM